ncbi:hypothetical protein ACIOHE_23655 [Streptomyces sp. NPDC087851]|uniref:hypothetical protein n=1 Tax=Streptomyces sp. NPDC087851 TaxID=3365810 RepID=UPI00380C830F
MTYHLISHEGSNFVGPSEYEREDQDAALALFLDVHDALSLHPNNQAGVVDYLMKKLPKIGAKDAPYARIEQMRHLTSLYRSFKSAYAAHARDQHGPKLPPHKVKQPEPLPEKLVPGQRVEMADPKTGELVTVIVPEPAKPDDEPKTDLIAVVLNAARTYCFDQLQRYERQLTTLENDSDIVEEAKRKAKEHRDTIRSISRDAVQLRKFYDVLELVAQSKGKHPEGTSVEAIVAAEKINLADHALNRKKLREFLERFGFGTAA